MILPPSPLPSLPLALSPVAAASPEPRLSGSVRGWELGNVRGGGGDPTFLTPGGMGDGERGHVKICILMCSTHCFIART